MKKIILFFLICTLFLLTAAAPSSADSFEAKDCTPSPADIQKEEAVSIAIASLYERFDLEDLETQDCEARFVTYTDLNGNVDGEPQWEIAIGRCRVVLDRHGKPVMVNGGGRDIPWESDTLALSVPANPVPGDGTAEEAIAKAWEVVSDGQTPWGDDRSGVEATAELIRNEHFCCNSDPVWLVTFSREEPCYKVLLRWDMEYISRATWGKEFLYDGMPRWVEEAGMYFPHGVRVEGFGRWTQEEQALFSDVYIPIVEALTADNPHFDDPYNELYWMTRHRYGVPGEGMISLDEAKAAAKAACVREGAAEKTFDTRYVEAALDVTDPENPVWRMNIGYDFNLDIRQKDSGYVLQINALSGEVTELKQTAMEDHTLFTKDIW